MRDSATDRTDCRTACCTKYGAERSGAARDALPGYIAKLNSSFSVAQKSKKIRFSDVPFFIIMDQLPNRGDVSSHEIV